MLQENSRLAMEVEQLKNRLDTPASSRDRVEELLEDHQISVEDLRKILNNLGSDGIYEAATSNISEKLSKADKYGYVIGKLKAYERIGEPDYIVETLKSAGDALEGYTSSGSVFNVEDCFEELEAYREIGTPDEVVSVLSEVRDTIKSYLDIGTIPYIQETVDYAATALESYQELGTVDEISEQLEEMDSVMEELNEMYIAKKVSKYSKDYGLDRVYVREFLEEFEGDPEKAGNLLEGLSAGRRGGDSSLNESRSGGSSFEGGSSRLERLYKGMRTSSHRYNKSNNSMLTENKNRW